MVTLNEVEIRLLGVMMEKSLTQPNAYPMTINSILLGANQKQNREPVVEYTEAEVATALGELIRKQLAVQAPPEPGARANRFAHRAVEMFHWDRREQAIMAELLMRGRQTAGELRSRAGRMTPFADLAAVETTLEQLKKYSPPFVEELREPGRPATRFRHLMSAERASATSAPSRTAPRVQAAGLPPLQGGIEGGTEVPTAAQQASARIVAKAITGDLEPRLDELENRVDHLESQIGEIRGLLEPGSGPPQQ